MNGTEFIVAALAFSAGGRIAPAGVISGRAGAEAFGPVQSSLTAQLVVWEQPQPEPLALTSNAAVAQRTFSSVPDFDRLPAVWTALDFAQGNESSTTSRQSSRWSTMPTPAGLPISQTPTVRPSNTKRDDQWSDPVGVLFAEESIRPSSGLARFIPTPGVGSMMMVAAIFPLKRRRA